MPDKLSDFRQLVADAALAHEMFGSDELEEYAKEYWHVKEVDNDDNDS